MRAGSTAARRAALAKSKPVPSAALVPPEIASATNKRCEDVLAFPAHDDHAPQIIPMGRLSRFPSLRDAIVPTLLPLLGHKSPSTRSRVIASLKSGLLAFFDEQSSGDMSPNDIDCDTISRFVWWLDRVVDDKAALSVGVRRSYLGDARMVLEPVSRETGNDRLAEAIREWPENPWPDAVRPSRELKTVPDAAAMSKLLRHCRDEIERRIEETEPLLAMFEAGDASDRLVAKALMLRELFIAGRAADPDYNVTDEVNAHCSQHMAHRFRKSFTPGAEELMPFIVVLLHYTRFNPAVLFDLRLSDVRKNSLGNAHRIVITARKRRPVDTWQTASFAIDASSTNPARLLDFLQRWTAIGREVVGSELYFVARGASRFGEIGPDIRNKGGGAIAGALTRMIKSAKVSNIPMKDMRKGVLDLVHLATGDTESVRKTGGQASQQVVIDHYRSHAAESRDIEMLARAAEERERWLLSDGRIDARKLPEKSDRSAATPGFSCLDRYASPMPGQKGQACHAYGQCPICPLAVMDLTSERSCAYAHLLLDAIERSFDGEDALSAGAYLGIWLPVAQRLADDWLPAFTDEARALAKKMDLPPLPEIE
ncbi:hypothetical protein [Sphingomonas sp. Leaf25]|uniref:hypothetical protein n=1 Tax=Sphingomonas sp. Leaf25 TaxID=1735692 RepID=UPI0006F98F99|nr:hypothetical protein [Sphingomonas sp. Leaf25]KQM98001.1 hypothetical protein ASE78_06935 [Sphingomonas sp. Leaf25]